MKNMIVLIAGGDNGESLQWAARVHLLLNWVHLREESEKSLHFCRSGMPGRIRHLKAFLGGNFSQWSKSYGMYHNARV